MVSIVRDCPAGILPGLRLNGHIHCADNGDCYEIRDGLPQAGASDPDLTTRG